jgi:putative Mg2+ transporter-C (MgtC) family protein
METLGPWLGNLHDTGLSKELTGLICIIASVICGGFVGYERERRDKPAGLRTVILLSVGTTIFTMASHLIAQEKPMADPARLAAQILPGIGFLGAGAIMQAHGMVVGLTTGATIWAVAAVGVMIGAGYVTAGGAFTFLIFFTLDILHKLDWLILGRCAAKKTVVVYRPDGGKTLPRIQEVVDRYRIPDSCIVHGERKPGEKTVEFPTCIRHRHHRIILKELADIAEVAGIEVER